MSEPRTLSCAHLLADPRGAPAGPTRLTLRDGRIEALLAAQGPVDDLFVMPTPVNAHDHGRPVRTSSIGAGGKPLEAWIPYLALFPSVDPYLAAALSLSHSALGGAGVVMMHYTRAQGFTDLPGEVRDVARAARDVGARVGFAIAMKDRNPLVYGPSASVLGGIAEPARSRLERQFLRPSLEPKAFIELADAVAEAAGGPDFDVQYGPNGPQWCSDALLEAVAEASARTGRRVHMHLLESRYQRAWADEAHPGGIVRHLDALGLLSERLTLAHCVWARPDELALLAERGVTIVSNPSSNLHLRSGIGPVAQMRVRGCRVAFGVDGRAMDEDDDMLREIRLAHLLHLGTGFKAAVTQNDILEMALVNGRRSVLNRADGGRLAPGEPADLLVLDWARLEDDRLRDDLDAVELVVTRATARHIRELIVGGRTIVRDGAITGIDLRAVRAELLAQMRAGMAGMADLAATLPSLEAAMAAHFEPGCC